MSPATVVVIGNFDGVHRGHRAVLGQIVKEARRRDALAVAITFDPHPRAVLHPENAPPLLQTDRADTGRLIESKQIAELPLLLGEHILIGAAIAHAKYLHRFAVTIIAEGDLDPGPLVQRRVVDALRHDGRLASGFQKIDQKPERRGILFLAEYP